MSSLRLVVAGLSLTTACAPSGPRAIERIFDPCATRVVAPVDATDEERASVDEALRLWNEAAGLHLKRDGAGELLRIELMDTLPALFGAYDDRAGVVLINRAITDPDARAIVLAHELGHAFGLRHVSPQEGASLMRAANTTVPPMPADADRLRALWGDCS